MDNTKEDIKRLFSLILGSKVNTISKPIEIDKKELFISTLQQLEICLEKENKIEEIGINISSITDPLWFIIENLVFAFYGSNVSDLVMWFLYERMDEDDEIQYYIGDDGVKYLFASPEDLWSYINHHFL